MSSKKVGAPPKFKEASTTMRLSRVVPTKHHNEWKQKVNQFINQLQQDYESNV
jgi:hypothetical protein